jgi:hypothetical protein
MLHPLKKLQSVHLAVWAFLVAVALLAYPKSMFHASLHAFQLWWHIVFPLVFPVYLCADWLLHVYLFRERSNRWIQSLTYVWFISQWTDFSQTANWIVAELKENRITAKEAEYVLSIFQATPIWMYVLWFRYVLHEPSWIAPIVIAHLCSEWVFLFWHVKTKMPSLPFPIVHHEPLGIRLGNGIQRTMQHVLQLSGWMIIASIVWTGIDITGIWALVTPTPPFLLLGMLDVPLGLNMLADSAIAKDASFFIPAVCSLLVSFGGLTGLFRIQPFLRHTKIRFSKLCFAKGRRALLTYVLASALLFIFHM